MDENALAGSRVTVPPWPPTEEQREEAGLLEELREGSRWWDWLAIAAVPVGLVTVAVVVGQPERSLVLSRAAPTPTSLLTAHFVHSSFAHLVDNLAAYLLVVPTAYVLAVLTHRRREFAATFVANLALLPPLLSGLDLLMYDSGVTLGFSGVTMAFVGLVALQAGTFVEERLSDGWEGDLPPALFFLGLAFVAARTVPAVGPRLAFAGGSALVAGYSLRGSFDAVRPVRRSIGRLRSDDAQLGIVGLLVVVLGLLAGFPDVPGSGAVVVNRFGHFAGFVVGFLAPYLAFRVLAGGPPVQDSPPEAV